MVPTTVAKSIGLKGRSTWLRLFGLREIASGIGILTQRRPTPWLWARVAGDALDLATLGSRFASHKVQRGRLGAAAAAVAGVAALDVLASRQFSSKSSKQILPLRARHALVIGKPREEIYAFWRNFEQLPRFMNHAESVRIIGDRRSHWVVKGPAGTRPEWDAETIEERPNELIRWRSLPGATVDNAGEVRFDPAPGNWGTIVRVSLEYHPPAGVLGATVAKLLGESPGKQLAIDLRRLKQLVETGEIARTEGQPAGRQRSTSRKFDDLVRA